MTISEQHHINDQPTLDIAISKGSEALQNCRHPDGYWWFTLQANDTINSEMVYLIHYMGLLSDPDYKAMEQGLAAHIYNSQNHDGSWSINHGADGDLSSTIECYLALKMAGYDIHSQKLQKARQFIHDHGGLSQCRIFTRIHLAMFGIIPWNLCPSMPVSLILFPNFQPINIYEFSSWARATIVPLLIIMDQQKTKHLGTNYLDELYLPNSHGAAIWSYNPKPWNSLENFFLQSDKVLKVLEKINVKPFRKRSLRACEIWVREHIARTEDIYPAMAYGAMALSVLGYNSKSDPTILKALKGLKNFQIKLDGEIISALPFSSEVPAGPPVVYQQCCVSPVWDTPWSSMALFETGDINLHKDLKKSAEWLVSKQIFDVYGDWALKNKTGRPGGWSFEFQNDYFPDVDDSIEVLLLLKALKLETPEIKHSQEMGVNWVLSMQCKNGGWAAFDVNNTKNWVNKIPFSDHAACQDPPTPDITGRCLELLAAYGYGLESQIVKKAIRFLEKTQENDGSWEGRWGVAYIYGTWCALQGLKAIGYDMDSLLVRRAVKWLRSIQNEDGGFGESCLSYVQKHYVPQNESVASQTAWALMGLVAGNSPHEAKLAADYLVESQDDQGLWDEQQHTGTGFPGHFYIRYHGYRYYFPLLALGKYRQYVAAK